MDITDLNAILSVAGIILIFAMIPYVYTHIQRIKTTKAQINKMINEVKHLMDGKVETVGPVADLSANKQYRQKLETARCLLDKILSIRSTYPKALHYYALYHIETGRLDLAEKNWTRAIQSGKNRQIFHYNLGKLYFERRDYDKSMLHYKKAIQTDPNYDPPHVGMGNIKFQQGKIYSAMGSYSYAARINNRNADALIGIGNCYMQTKNFEKAKGSYEQAYRLDKTNKHLNAVLSGMCIARKQYHKADKILLDAIDRYPSYSVFHKQLGDIKSKLNKESDAVEAYTNFLRIKCEKESLSQFIKSKFESYLAVEIISDLLKKKKKINYDQFIKELNNVVTVYLINQRILGKLTATKKKAYQQFSSYYIDKVVVSMAQNQKRRLPKTADQAILAS
jgi:tetratricopeptide (TPR) repeat protein